MFPLQAKEASLDVRPMSKPSASLSFNEYFDGNENAVEELMDISMYYTRSDPLYAPQVYDYMLDELMKRWDTLKSWRAVARTIARRYSPKLRARERRVAMESFEGQDLRSLATNATPPDELVLLAEEEECLGNAIADLRVEARHILQAFANTKSMRDAARMISMPESTFRTRFHAIISELQRSLDG